MIDYFNLLKEIFEDITDLEDYYMPEAEAYGITFYPDNQYSTTLLASCADAYDLIDTIAKKKISSAYNAIAILSTGTASPIENDENSIDGVKKAKLLITITSNHEFYTAYSFEGENEIEVDDQAEGAMKDYLLAIYPYKEMQA